MKKIKILAMVFAAILAIGSIALGIFLLEEADEVVGCIVMFGGVLVAWVSSWLLYGFGELVDKTCDIERILRTGATGAKAEENDDSLPEI